MLENARNNNKKYQIEFGRNLCAERNRKGLSQEELGERANIDGRYISRLERGEINPTLTTLISLLLALDVSFDKLCNLKK